MVARLDSLEKRVDVLQWVAVLEAEVRELRERLGSKTASIPPPKQHTTSVPFS
ncbi:MAG: hypothetical protein QXM16_07030 [Nitrososphaerota archaeon]